MNLNDKEMNSNFKGKPKKRIDFPKLMESGTSNKIVVLFINKTEGVCIFIEQDSAFYKRGTYRSDWIVDNFSDFNGTIEISND